MILANFMLESEFKLMISLYLLFKVKHFANFGFKVD